MIRLKQLFTITVLILLALGFNTDECVAKEKRYTVKIYRMDKTVFRGTLTSVSEKGLFVTSKSADTATFIDATQIKEIKVRRKGKSGIGTTVGFLTGVALGVSGMVLLKEDDNLDSTLQAVGAGVLTFISTAIGGAIGSAYDEKIIVQGRSEDYLQTLNRLKSFAPAVTN